MTGPEYLVISTADWNNAIGALGQAWLLTLALVFFAAKWDLYSLEHFIRRALRRRRLRRIRQERLLAEAGKGA